MVIQVYISIISGNSEIKSRQQRVLSILDSKGIQYEIVDITGENSEDSKIFMSKNSTAYGGTMNDPNPKYPLPPQFFNDGIYCGDYNLFDTANEMADLEIFLKINDDNKKINQDTITSNSEITLQ